MGAWFLDVDILARLASPDRLQGMVVIRRGDRDGIDGFVLERLAQVGEAGRTLPGHALGIVETLLEYRLIHIADSGDLDVGHLGVGPKVGLALPVNSHTAHADGIVRAGESICANRRASRYRIHQEVSPVHRSFPPRSCRASPGLFRIRGPIGSLVIARNAKGFAWRVSCNAKGE